LTVRNGRTTSARRLLYPSRGTLVVAVEMRWAGTFGNYTGQAPVYRFNREEAAAGSGGGTSQIGQPLEGRGNYDDFRTTVSIFNDGSVSACRVESDRTGVKKGNGNRPIYPSLASGSSPVRRRSPRGEYFDRSMNRTFHSDQSTRQRDNFYA